MIDYKSHYRGYPHNPDHYVFPRRSGLRRYELGQAPWWRHVSTDTWVLIGMTFAGIAALLIVVFMS